MNQRIPERKVLSHTNKCIVDRAVSVVKRAGYHAWINPVGHVAVDPQGIASF